MEETMMILTAITEACEGHLELHTHGIAYAETDELYNVTMHMEDGTTQSAETMDAHTLEDAIFDWRQQHPAFFQRILGAMM